MIRTLLYIQLVAYLLLFSTISAQTISIEGIVKDKKTNKPLPYTSVVVKGAFMGTMAGPNGEFSIYLPDSIINDTIQFNHLGYKTYESPINKVSNSVIEVRLKTAPTNIEAVIVKPLYPEDVLREAVRNISKNYPQEPFISEGFYLEELIENDVYINFAEAFVEIYSPHFGDTSKCQVKILQGRTRDSLGHIRFMETFIKKKSEKDIRKAIRKGDSIPEKDSNAIQIMFGGPKNALLTDFVRNQNMFLDSTKFKKFDFTYENDNSLGDKNLYVIRCKNKRPINYLYMNALVYIDKETYAIVKITSVNTLKVPTIAKPILSLYRIKVGEVQFNIDNEYRNVNKKWYPSKVLLSFNAEAIKKYRKGKYDHGVFSSIQAFATTNIKVKDVEKFKEDEIMTDEPLAKQFEEYDPSFWENRTKIEYSVK